MLTPVSPAELRQAARTLRACADKLDVAALTLEQNGIAEHLFHWVWLRDTALDKLEKIVDDVRSSAERKARAAASGKKTPEEKEKERALLDPRTKSGKFLAEQLDIALAAEAAKRAAAKKKRKT